MDPSTQGHAGAGQFSSQAYSFDLGERRWTELAPEGEAPPPRGWLAGVAVPEGLLVHAGNSNSNERESDMWLLEVGAS